MLEHVARDSSRAVPVCGGVLSVGQAGRPAGQAFQVKEADLGCVSDECLRLRSLRFRSEIAWTSGGMLVPRSPPMRDLDAL